jgi:hypothetical protein
MNNLTQIYDCEIHGCGETRVRAYDEGDALTRAVRKLRGKRFIACDATWGGLTNTVSFMLARSLKTGGYSPEGRHKARIEVA